jgi:hypothetical protein
VTGAGDCVVIGADTILHLHERPAVSGADYLVTFPSGYISRLLGSLGTQWVQ